VAQPVPGGGDFWRKLQNFWKKLVMPDHP